MYKRIETLTNLEQVLKANGYLFSSQRQMTEMGEIIKLVCWDTKGERIVANAQSTVGVQSQFQWNLGMFEAERVFGKKED